MRMALEIKVTSHINYELQTSVYEKRQLEAEALTREGKDARPERKSTKGF
jgi:hypothetical protein